MRDSTPIVMRCLPEGTLETAVEWGSAMGYLPVIGAAIAAAACDPATGRRLIPTDQAGLDRLDEMVEDVRHDLRHGIGAIASLMSCAAPEDVSGAKVVEIGFLLQSLAHLDEDMLHAEQVIRDTREYLEGQAAEQRRFEALWAARGKQL
jgi:hypothetical protein